MKKLHLFMLKSFVGPFVATFYQYVRFDHAVLVAIY